MRVVILLSLCALAQAFVTPKSAFVSSSPQTALPTTTLFAEPEDASENNEFSLANLPTMATTTAAFWSMTATMASAAGPDWGIFEGRIGSLLHPITMFSLLALSISTAILGFNWRRQRTIGDEISALKKTLPDLGGAKTVSEALEQVKAAEEVDNAMVNKLQAALPIQKEIDELTAERKELSQGNNRDKHFNQGTLLAFLGTCFAIEGPLNTYARTGKLFPGPHLFAGAGLVCLWALAYACVPAMQKGNDTARTIHIGANLAGIGMFAWQVQSGIPILLKTIEKTSWP